MLRSNEHFCKGGVIAIFTIALDQVMLTIMLTTQHLLILVSFELKDFKYI